MMDSTYTSAFTTKYVPCDLESLKYRFNLSEFHIQFLDLAKLVGETVHTAVFSVSNGFYPMKTPPQPITWQVSPVPDQISSKCFLSN
jgi:hypothetical protein